MSFGNARRSTLGVDEFYITRYTSLMNLMQSKEICGWATIGRVRMYEPKMIQCG